MQLFQETSQAHKGTGAQSWLVLAFPQALGENGTQEPPDWENSPSNTCFLLLGVFCHHLPATILSLPEPGSWGAPSFALSYCPYSTTRADPKQDIYLPILEL